MECIKAALAMYTGLRKDPAEMKNWDEFTAGTNRQQGKVMYSIYWDAYLGTAGTLL